MSDTPSTSKESESAAKAEHLEKTAKVSQPESKSTLTGSRKIESSKKTKDILRHESLMAFVKPLYSEQNLNKTYRESFQNIELTKNGSFAPLTQDNLDELLRLSQENDSDHKLTLSLAEFLLEKRGNPKLRQDLLGLVEYLVSHSGTLKTQGITSIFQVWLDKGDCSMPLSLLCNQIDMIKDGVGKKSADKKSADKKSANKKGADKKGVDKKGADKKGADKKGEPKFLPEQAKNNLKCIAAIWLYIKEKGDFERLSEQLSNSAFSLKGETCNEGYAFAFLAIMSGSTHKEKFSHFLSHIKSNEQKLRSEAARHINEKLALNSKVKNLKGNIFELNSAINKRDDEIKRLHARIAELQAQLSATTTEAKHQGIHQRDELKQYKSKMLRVLEDGVLVNLESAKTANSRSEPRTRVVQAKLEDVIEIIEEQVVWLKK